MSRIVVKIGSSTLTEPTGGLSRSYIANLAAQVAELRSRGNEVILVSSGAIAAGAHRLGLPKGRPRTIPLKQAAAATGQGLLMQAYSDAFAVHRTPVAQILLTRDDFQHRSRFLNARNTLFALLKLRAVPIINENDTVAIEEIRIGENDTLAALVAAAIGADLLIMLSDVDGLLDERGQVVPVINSFTPEMTSLAGDSQSAVGTGGMQTKLQAAHIACDAGVDVAIAHGRRPRVLVDVASGEAVCTRIPAHERLTSRKHWLAFSASVRGAILVNRGAMERIVMEGKSLLPSGVVATEGDFASGDLVSLCLAGGEEFARGLSNYSAEEVERIKGRHSREIRTLLGYKDYDEVVHRDNMAVRRHDLAPDGSMTNGPDPR
jgi:glutamate 5-kinase